MVRGHVRFAPPTATRARSRDIATRRRLETHMKEAVVETLLIGSGSQAEADRRVQFLLDLGVSRGFLTYEELNEKLPDEVVSPDKLDSLLMRIDEMGIKLIDEFDIGDYQKGGKKKAAEPAPAPAPAPVDGKAPPKPVAKAR